MMSKPLKICPCHLWNPAIPLALLAVITTYVSAPGQENLEIEVVNFSEDGVHLTVEGADDSYYLLESGSALNDFLPEDAVLGKEGDLTFSDRIFPDAEQMFYRVRKVSLETPDDVDGDAIDDVTELLHPESLDAVNGWDGFWDFDFDGISNRDEVRLGTNHEVPDGISSGLPAIDSTTPFNGEDRVSTTRKVSVRFSDRINRWTLNSSNFKVSANGKNVAGSIEVSTTEAFATFLPDEFISPSTEVRVTVIGDTVLGRNGQALDADGDGEPGGTYQFEYRTLPLTPIRGTNVFGYVFDAMKRDADGNSIPVEGVTIRLDDLPISAKTDATGRFQLNDLPAPEFFAHIDGSTAVSGTPGTGYPVIGKKFHSFPGQTVQLNHHGHVFDIYIPLMTKGDVQPLDNTTTSVVKFGDGGMADVEAILPDIDPALLAEMTLSIPAGSPRTSTGTIANTAAIIPVPPSRTPSPLPPMTNPSLVVSVQAGTDGAFNGSDGGVTGFDVPAPITFPNTDGLAPGEKSLIYSFDHAAGTWVSIGTATVSADGRRLKSDPGVGVRAPGWHFAFPLSPGRGDTPRGGGGVGPGSSGGPNTGGGPAPGGGGPGPGGSGPGPGGNGSPTSGTLTPGTGGPGGNGPGGGPAPGGGGPGVGGPGTPGGAGGDDGTIGEPGSIPEGSDCFFIVCIQVEGYPDTRIRTDRDGLFYQHLPASTPYTIVVYDPKTGLVYNHSGVSAPAGQPTSFGDVVFTESTAPDADGNGLPDDVDCALSECPRYDFGPPESPVSAGYAGVSEATNYTAEAGHGWIAGTVSSVSRSAQPSALIRDFVFAEDATFAVDLIPGIYDVSITLGDQAEARPRQKVRIENILRANDTTMAGQFVTTTSRVMVADGQLTLELEDAAVSAVEISCFRDGIEYLNEIPGLDMEGFFYFAIHNLDSDFVMRNSVLATNGEFLCGNGVGLAPETAHCQWVYHVESGWIGKSQFVTPQVGAPFAMPEIVIWPTWDLPDSDGDGIPDIGEWIIGTNPNNPDTDADGIADLADIVPPLNPFDDLSFPIGEIAQLPLEGEANEIYLTGLISGIGLTAFVATGSEGLAIVDVSQADNPIALGQLDLPGDATDVVADPSTGFAAVATGTGGVQLIDITDRMAPVFVKTLQIEGTLLAYASGILYVGADTELHSFSIFRNESGLSAEGLDVLGVSEKITDMAQEHQKLYVMQLNREIQVVDISRLALGSEGSAVFEQGGSTLFVGGGNGYAPAANFSRGGVATFDLADPNAPALISLSDVPEGFLAPKRDVAVSGSGIGMLVGQGARQDVTLLDLSDPENAYELLTVYDLAEEARAVAIASGFGFVANGTAGLRVYNYLAFDALGTPPTVTIDTTALDVDSATPGIQMRESTVVPIFTTITDDVQVRDVRLLVDGDPLLVDVAFPYDLSIRIPPLADATTVQLRVQATDTGGNIGLSEPLQIDIVPDTERPAIVSVNPQDGAVRGKGFTSVLIEFSEPMDATKISAATVGIALDIGMALPIEPISITSRSFDTTFQLVYPPFQPGEYRMSLFTSAITDVAGNSLGDSLIVHSFEVAEATAVFVTSEGGDWNTGSNWDSGTVPDDNDDVLLDLPAGAEVTFSGGESTIKNLTGKTPVTVSGGILEVTDSIRLDAALTLDGGAIKGATILPGSDGQCLEVTPDKDNLLIGVTLGCDVVLDQTNASVRVDEGITLNSSTITLNGNLSKIGFVGDESIEGNGNIFFSPSSTNHIEMAETGTLTIGSGIIIEGSRGVIGGVLGWVADCTVVNKGIIRSTINSGELFIETRGGHFTNGTTGRLLALAGGTLRIAQMMGNLGETALITGRLVIDNGTYNIDQPIEVETGALDLGGLWENNSVLTLNLGGRLILNGTVRLDKLGTINRVRSSSSVELCGNLDLQGEALTLNATTGNWLLRNGKLRNGIYNSEDNAILQIGEGREGLLDNMILNGDVEMIESQPAVRVDNGLTLNGNFRMKQGGDFSLPSIGFVGDETISGTGTIFCGATKVKSFIEMAEPGTLTIGREITIDGVFDIGGVRQYGQPCSVINHGTIRARSSFETTPVITTHDGTFSNSETGRIETVPSFGIIDIKNLIGNLGTVVDNSILILNGNYTINEPITADYLSLNGQWTNSSIITVSEDAQLLLGGSFTLDQLGTINRSGGTVTLSGDLDLQGGTLTLNEATGSWKLGGTLRNGHYTGEGSASLEMSFAGSTFDNMTVDGDLAIDSGQLNVNGGLTLNATILMNGGKLVFQGNETISGTGTIRSLAENARRFIEMGIGETLTIGEGITIEGPGSIKASIINHGRIHANTPAFDNSPNGDLLIDPSFPDQDFTGSVINAPTGRFEASNGGRLRIRFLISDTGTRITSTGGTIE